MRSSRVFIAVLTAFGLLMAAGVSMLCTPAGHGAMPCCKTVKPCPQGMKKADCCKFVPNLPGSEPAGSAILLTAKDSRDHGKPALLAIATWTSAQIEVVLSGASSFLFSLPATSVPIFLRNSSLIR
jgi:hypothetical protein